MNHQAFGHYDPNHEKRWEDWITAALGIWFFVTPWIRQFGVGGAPAWDAWILGAAVFLVSMSAIGRLNLRQEWVNMVLGFWIFLAPWVLHFDRDAAASWDHWIIGVLVFIFSAVTIVTSRPGSHAAP